MLAGLIRQMKAEIRAAKSGNGLATIPEGGSQKKRAIAAYMREHPKENNKSVIARAVQTDRSTVRKYFKTICDELGIR
jgi:hypothetical protein